MAREEFHPALSPPNTLSQAKEPFMAKHTRAHGNKNEQRTRFSECGLLMAPAFFYFVCYHHHFPSFCARERAVFVNKPLSSSLRVSLSLFAPNITGKQEKRRQAQISPAAVSLGRALFNPPSRPQNIFNVSTFHNNPASSVRPPNSQKQEMKNINKIRISRLTTPPEAFAQPHIYIDYNFVIR